MGEASLGQLLLATAGAIPVLLIVLAAIAQLRDELVNQGWLSIEGRLGKMTRRKQLVSSVSVLQAAGLDGRTANAVRSAVRQTSRRELLRMRRLHTRLDRQFLIRARPWIVELAPAYDWRGSKYYLDIMGAIGSRESNQTSVEQVHADWIRLLVDRQFIPDFDCLIAPKDGNIRLCYAVAEILQRPLIVCKGRADVAKIRRPNAHETHFTDFEGLQAFLHSQDAVARLPDDRFSALVIDDSCSNGSQISSVAERFNALLQSTDDNIQIGVASRCFTEVEHAVVLFRVLASEGHSVNDEQLNRSGLTLHALLALGPDDLEAVTRMKRRALHDDALSGLKEDSSCAASKELFD